MNQKQKNRILIVAFLLLIVIAYKFAISKTFEAKDKYKSLQQEAIAFKNLPNQLSTLKLKQRYYDSILNKYNLGKASIQNSLLEIINSHADSLNLKVDNFTEPHRIQQNELSINTYQFTLTGEYNDIIRLIHVLEQKTKFGEIISLHFEKQKNFRSGTSYLQAHVLLKSFG